MCSCQQVNSVCLTMPRRIAYHLKVSLRFYMQSYIRFDANTDLT